MSLAAGFCRVTTKVPYWGAVLVAGATIVLFSVILGAKLPYAVTPVTLFYVLSRDGAGFVTSKMTLASCPLILAGLKPGYTGDWLKGL